MFLVEIGAGLAVGSASLQADALDFLGDAANPACSWWNGTALPRHGSLRQGREHGCVRPLGNCDGCLACSTGDAAERGRDGRSRLRGAHSQRHIVRHLVVPQNGRLEYAFRVDCTRNDVLGYLAVLLAALGVFGTGTGWPDLVVAATMATLALQGASTVLRRSLGELRQRRPTSCRPSHLISAVSLRGGFILVAGR